MTEPIDSENETDKFCVDCRFSQLDKEEWICSHPSALVQPQRSRVTGILPPIQQISCWRARLREIRGHESRCGAIGRFWEPR